MQQIGRERGGLCATNEQENKEAAVPHSSLLLEKIPQEREKYLRKWEGIEENEEKDELGESGDSGASYEPGEKCLRR